ncbi:MAG: hypothetical protein AAFX76_01505 [Planctomycetota bacterium]
MAAAFALLFATDLVLLLVLVVALEPALEPEADRVRLRVFFATGLVSESPSASLLVGASVSAFDSPDGSFAAVSLGVNEASEINGTWPGAGFTASDASCESSGVSLSEVFSEGSAFCSSMLLKSGAGAVEFYVCSDGRIGRAAASGIV